MMWRSSRNTRIRMFQTVIKYGLTALLISEPHIIQSTHAQGEYMVQKQMNDDIAFNLIYNAAKGNKVDFTDLRAAIEHVNANLDSVTNKKLVNAIELYWGLTRIAQRSEYKDLHAEAKKSITNADPYPLATDYIKYATAQAETNRGRLTKREIEVLEMAFEIGIKPKLEATRKKESDALADDDLVFIDGLLRDLRSKTTSKEISAIVDPVILSLPEVSTRKSKLSEVLPIRVEPYFEPVPGLEGVESRVIRFISGTGKTAQPRPDIPIALVGYANDPNKLVDNVLLGSFGDISSQERETLGTQIDSMINEKGRLEIIPTFCPPSGCSTLEEFQEAEKRYETEFRSKLQKGDIAGAFALLGETNPLNSYIGDVVKKTTIVDVKRGSIIVFGGGVAVSYKASEEGMKKLQEWIQTAAEGAKEKFEGLILETTLFVNALIARYKLQEQLEGIVLKETDHVSLIDLDVGVKNRTVFGISKQHSLDMVFSLSTNGTRLTFAPLARRDSGQTVEFKGKGELRSEFGKRLFGGLEEVAGKPKEGEATAKKIIEDLALSVTGSLIWSPNEHISTELSVTPELSFTGDKEEIVNLGIRGSANIRVYPWKGDDINIMVRGEGGNTFGKGFGSVELRAENIILSGGAKYSYVDTIGGIHVITGNVGINIEPAFDWLGKKLKEPRRERL